MAGTTWTAAFPPPGQGHLQNNNTEQHSSTWYHRKTITCTLGSSTTMVLQLWQLMHNQVMLLPLVQHITATKNQTADINQANPYHWHSTHQPYYTVSECTFIGRKLVCSCQQLPAIHDTTFCGKLGIASSIHSPRDTSYSCPLRKR